MIFNRIDYSQIDEETYDKLPRFAGAYGEDIFAFLEEFYEVCVAIKPRGVSMEEFKFKIFPLSLDYHALSWYTHLWLPLFHTYREFEQGFLTNFATPSQKEELRLQIASIQQFVFEPFDRYYDRFLRWMRWCPDDVFPEGWLLRYFLNGMIPYERQMMDVMAGGSILDCELSVVWDIYDARAEATEMDAYSQSALMQPEDSIQNVQLQEEPIQQSDDILNRISEPEAEPLQLCLEDMDVVEATGDPGDVSDEALQVVLTICNEEFKAEPEDVILAQCSTMIALDEEAHKDKETLGGKARKRRIKQEKRLEEDGTTMRSREKIRNRAVEGRSPSRFPPLKSRHTKFGWKPGWRVWRRLAPEIKKQMRAHWGKFDGVHPWAPNL